MMNSVLEMPAFGNAFAYSFLLQGIGANSTQSYSLNDRESLFPMPGTIEWGHLNRRRAELIWRKVRGELSKREEQELDWLQRETFAAVEQAFPRPPANLRRLEELEQRLKERLESEGR